MKYVFLFTPNPQKAEKIKAILNRYNYRTITSSDTEGVVYEEMRIYVPTVAIVDFVTLPHKGKKIYKFFRDRVHIRDVPMLILGADEEFMKEASEKDRYVHFITVDDIISKIRLLTEI